MRWAVGSTLARACSVLRCQSSVVRITVGLISTTSSRLRPLSLRLPNRLRVTTLLLLPGRPELRLEPSDCINPPMATM